MPHRGRLAENLNLRRRTLARRIARFRHETVYSYIVITVECLNGRLRQEGSAPNFQGDLITLCSCKHWMRTFRDTESWKGVWIAGYTRRDLGNRLFYLMRISEAFESHRELWLSDLISEETKTKKAAHQSKFGDIYQPKSEASDAYSHRDYIRPHTSHVHRRPDIWRQDIDYYSAQHGRRPALLVGNPNYSFLWDEPLITYPFTLYQGQKRTCLSELFPFIEPAQGRRRQNRVIPQQSSGAQRERRVSVAMQSVGNGNGPALRGVPRTRCRTHQPAHCR